MSEVVRGSTARELEREPGSSGEFRDRGSEMFDSRFRNSVLAALERKVGRDPLCEDAVQDALAYLAQHEQELESHAEDRCFAWAVRAAFWAYCNAYRGHTRREQHEFHASSVASVDVPTPDALLGLAQRSRQLIALVRSLPARFSVVIITCDIDGLSDREAAEKLGIPLGTVKTRRRDGHALLRKLCVSQGLV